MVTDLSEAARLKDEGHQVSASTVKVQQRLIDFLFESVTIGRTPDWINEILPRITPEAAREKDEDRRLPLHYAAAFKAPIQVVDALVMAYPEARREEDKTGRRPLHWAFDNKAPLEVVSALGANLRLVDFLAKMRSTEGSWFDLEGNAVDWIKDVLPRITPEAAREKDEDGRLPLHLAAEKAPVEVVDALLKAYPEGAMEEDNQRLVPLRLVPLRYAAREEVSAALRAAMAQQHLIYFLYEVFAHDGTEFWIKNVLSRITPEAAREKVNMAHYEESTLFDDGTVDWIKDVLPRITPEAAREKVDMAHYAESSVFELLEMGIDISSRMLPFDRLPLHWAAENKAPLEVVDALLKAYPEGAREEDTKNRQLPLHLALENQAPFEVVDALLKAYPKGARKWDKNGRLPLHLAVDKKAPAGVAAALRAAMAAVAEANLQVYLNSANDEQLALHRAVLEGAPVGVINAIIQAYPEALNQGDYEGRTPAYLAGSHFNDEEGNYPILDLLIDDHNAVFLSRHAAMLSDREKHIRALEFLVLATVLGGCSYGYLVGGKNLTTTCDTYYHGMLLQPYLFDFVAVFLFKFVQFMFEQVLVPGLDFLSFAAYSWAVERCRSCCRAGARVSIDAQAGSVTGSSSESKQEQEGTQELGRVSALVTLGDSYPNRDLIPAAPNQSSSQDWEKGITMNPLGASASSIVRAGDLEKGRPSLLDTNTFLKAATSAHDTVTVAVAGAGSAQTVESGPGSGPDVITANVNMTWSSRVLFKAFGEKTVKAWRKKKYKAAEKTDPEYMGKDLWRQTPYLFLYLQCVSSFISFVVSAARVDRSLTAWDQYTDFYATIVNSSIPMTLFSLGKMMWLDGREKQRDGLPAALHVYILFLVCLLVPPFYTHILPGAVLYCWVFPIVPALSSGILGILLMIVKGKMEVEIDIAKIVEESAMFRYHWQLLVEMVCRFGFIFLFHVLFNWASLVYAQGLPLTPQGYIGVLAQDWHLRSQSQCFLTHAYESSHGLVTLFSWF